MSLQTDRLIELRNSKNLSKKEAAEALGIDQSRYGKYELGQREPDLDTLRAIAAFFGVTMDYLCDGAAAASGAPQIAAILERLGGEMRDLTPEEAEDVGRQAEFMIRYVKEKHTT